MSYVVACYGIVLASVLLYAGALLRARSGLRKALRGERNRDLS